MGQKNTYLKTLHRNINNALQQAIIFGDFSLHVSDTSESALHDILEIAMKRGAQLINFTEGCFFLVEEATGDFVAQLVRPANTLAVFAAEVEYLIQLKLFSWVIKRKKPVFFKSQHGNKQLMLHVLTTATRVRGMFCCYLAEEYRGIDDHRLTLFSLFMYNCANALQVYELHKWNKGVTQKLEQNIQCLSQSKEKLQVHHNQLEQLVVERTECLATTNKKLKQEIDERRQAEMTLAKAHKELEERVRQRTVELGQAQLQLVIHEKLASVGQLANGVAHELYNPLNFIRTNMACLEGYLDDFADLLNLYEDLAESCRSQSLLPELTKAIDSQKQLICYEKTREESLKIFKENCSGFERITEVVNILRNFSNAGLHDQMGYFDLNRAIEDTVMLSGNITEQGISIETNFAQLPLLSGSPSLIKQALLNVLINSMQAVGSSLSATDGKIMIRTFVDGKHVGCAIEDNGPGISEQEQCRIFDPFFSTREPGYGKGLGLSITYDIIVHKHGGKIACVCPAAGGTTVTLLFPLVEPVMG